MLANWTRHLVEFCGRRPWLVITFALGWSAACWLYASRLQLRTDLLELLPRDSPGFQAFERQLGKLGGGATLLVIVESPNAEANHRFVDDLAANIERFMRKDGACGTRCTSPACAQCRPQLIARVEPGTKPIQDFFARYRWLYAPLDELRDAESRLDAAVAKESGLVEDLEAEDSSQTSGTQPNQTALSQLVEDIEGRFNAIESRINPARSGYFESNDSTSVGLRIVANSTPLGDTSGDKLFAEVKRIVALTNPVHYHPAAVVGYAGDIPNSLAERNSLMSDAVWATLAALALVLLGIAVYFRSAVSVIIVGLPAVIGVGAAYAFAAAVFGYVNTTGAFLGAIILGNGINYPIVLLSRYEEFVARGQHPDTARVTAVQNAFRAELVGAAVASIAYGSLTFTRFRGFSQFGVIGCVGMALVWCVTIVLVPALLTVVERARRHRGLASRLLIHTRAAGPVSRWLSNWGRRHSGALLLAASVVAAIAVWQLPGFVRDPWEYQFNRLGSRASKSGGAGTWSVKAERVFGGKTNVGGAMMLAASAEQAQAIKQILAKDSGEAQGQLIEDVVVMQDFIPGSRAAQLEKLGVIRSIRQRLTPRVMSSMSPELHAKVARLMPPRDLKPIAAAELPELLRTQFEDRAGNLGTVFYVKYRNSVVLSDGKTLLRIANLTDNIDLPHGGRVQTASRATIFAEMIRSMRRDGPLASLIAFTSVLVVVVIATHDVVGAIAVIFSLLWGAGIMLGGAVLLGERLNFINFIAIPITLGIGCEYPFNIYDRSRLLGGDMTAAVERAGTAVALCSYTTIVGYCSLLFADSQALESFGRMAVLGEAACSCAALLILPALVRRLRPRVLYTTRASAASTSPR